MWRYFLAIDEPEEYALYFLNGTLHSNS